MHSNRNCLHVYAGSIAEKNPDLLKELQERWKDQKTQREETLDQAFQRLAGNMPAYEPDSEAVELCALSPDRNRLVGSRTLSVNVCHLLQVDCCINCNKNAVPKFGALEFRIFNAALGTPLQLYVAFVERLVQAACTKNLDKFGDAELLLLEGDRPDSTDLSPMLKWLDLDPQMFRSAFETEVDQKIAGGGGAPGAAPGGGDLAAPPDAGPVLQDVLANVGKTEDGKTETGDVAAPDADGDVSDWVRGKLSEGNTIESPTRKSEGQDKTVASLDRQHHQKNAPAIESSEAGGDALKSHSGSHHHHPGPGHKLIT
jgi:hypothetical protein